MKLCPKCNHTFWPYLMVVLIAGLGGFMTWLTLTLSEIGEPQRTIACGVVVLAVGATLLHYVRACMKRHCQHSDEAASRS